MSVAVFGSPLTVPGEFLEGGEILPARFLQKIEIAISRFTVPPLHHVPPAQLVPLLPALLATKFMFEREDASVWPLPPLYRGPSLVLEQRTKFFPPSIG